MLFGLLTTNKKTNEQQIKALGLSIKVYFARI